MKYDLEDFIFGLTAVLLVIITDLASILMTIDIIKHFKNSCGMVVETVQIEEYEPDRNIDIAFCKRTKGLTNETHA